MASTSCAVRSVLPLAPGRPLVPLLRGLGRHPGAILGAKRHRLAGCLPIAPEAGPEVLDEPGGLAVEVPDIGAAALPAVIALHGDAVHPPVHLRRAVETQSAVVQSLREFGARIGIDGDGDLVHRRQPGLERLQLHAGRHVPQAVDKIASA